MVIPRDSEPWEDRDGHCQSKFYTARSRTREGWVSTVFAHELPPRSAGFDAENRLYLFALTMASSAASHRQLPVKAHGCLRLSSVPFLKRLN